MSDSIFANPTTGKNLRACGGVAPPPRTLDNVLGARMLPRPISVVVASPSLCEAAREIVEGKSKIIKESK